MPISVSLRQHAHAPTVWLALDIPACRTAFYRHRADEDDAGSLRARDEDIYPYGHAASDRGRRSASFFQEDRANGQDKGGGVVSGNVECSLAFRRGSRLMGTQTVLTVWKACPTFSQP